MAARYSAGIKNREVILLAPRIQRPWSEVNLRVVHEEWADSWLRPELRHMRAKKRRGWGFIYDVRRMWRRLRNASTKINNASCLLAFSDCSGGRTARKSPRQQDHLAGRAREATVSSSKVRLLETTRTCVVVARLVLTGIEYNVLCQCARAVPTPLNLR